MRVKSREITSHQVGTIFGDELAGIHLQVGSGIAQLTAILETLYDFALQSVVIA